MKLYLIFLVIVINGVSPKSIGKESELSLEIKYHIK